MADRLDGLIISEILADNAGKNAVDIDGDGRINKADEFIEIQNTSANAISLDGFQLWSGTSGLLFGFGAGATVGAGQTATIIGNYTGTPPAGFYSAGLPENGNWLADGEAQRFDSIFFVNSNTGEYMVLSYGQPPRVPVLPAGFPGTTRIGAGETINSGAPNGTSFLRDANGNFVEGPPTPNTPGITCFVTGTLIDTEEGPLPVETLRPGVGLLTRDNGFQPLLARRTTGITANMIVQTPMLAPVRIGAGTFGATQNIDVSGAHALLWCDVQAELLFGNAEVLVPARHLLGQGATPTPRTSEAFAYHHLLLAQHEVLCAHGVWSESLFMGDQALRARTELSQWDIHRDVVLRDIRHTETARPLLHAYEVEALLNMKNRRAA